MNPTPAPAIRPAATLLLVRDDPGFEVLMVKRHHQIDFASGALVFPGGKTASEDHDERWLSFISCAADISADDRALRIAAIREAFEEASLLLARTSDGVDFIRDDRVDAARPAIARDEASFLELVADLGLKLNLDALTVFARWITPDMMPKRFDTWFYVARAPEEQLAACDGRETVDAEWIAPTQALQMAEQGQRTIIFPTRMNLQLLGESASSAAAIASASSRELVTVEPRVEKRPGGDVLVIPPNAGYGDVVEPLANVR